jgi:pentatricopeptide repeat protein
MDDQVELLNYSMKCVREGWFVMLLHTTCWLVGSVKRGGVGKLMDQMKSVGINPKLITSNTLIYGFCNVGKFDKASCLFDQLKSIDQSPTLLTYIVDLQVSVELEI